jgi:CHAD domain-containing protein
MAAAKEVEGLDCGAGAPEGIGLVLRTRFDEMYNLREAVLGPEDVKGVHDMRVASRRLRSALRDFRGFYERKGLPKRRLKEVARALGDVRDQDVAIEALEEMLSEASGAAAEGVGRLIDERRGLRARARHKLGPLVAEEPLGELRRKFLSWLEHAGYGGGRDKPSVRRSLGTAQAVSFRRAGAEVIESRLTEVLGLGDSIHHPFEFEPLHRMRIASKRLRYALELFSPCWGGTLKPVAREVSELQTALGDLRDCDTWIADLGPRLDLQRGESEGAGVGVTDPRVRPAATWLLGRFTRERGEHFCRALECWQKWEADGFFGRVRNTLRDAQTSKQASAKAPAAAEGVSAEPAPATHEPGAETAS